MNTKSLLSSCALLLLLFCQSAFAKNHLVLRIEGIKGAALTNAKKQFAINKSSHATLNTKTQLQRLFEESKKTLLDAIKPYGYFKASLKGTLTQTNYHNWTFYYKISPGPPLNITHLNINVIGPGKQLLEMNKLVDKLPLKLNTPLNMDHYENTKDSLLFESNALGFLQAKLITHKIDINLTDYQSSLAITLDTGKRYYFGHIKIKPNALSDSLTTRFLTFQSGEPFSPKAILQSQQNLSASDYFQRVAINTDLKKIKQTNDVFVPIMIDPVLRKPEVYHIGLGYGTLTGARTNLGVNFRRINKYGHHMKFLLNLSEVNTGLAARYFIPGSNPLTDQYYVGANIGLFDPNDDGKSIFHLFTLGTKLGLSHFWKIALDLNYLIDKYQINEEPYENTRALSPEITLTRLSVNNAINPTRGSKLSLMMRFGSERALSSASFIQARLDGKTIIPLTDNAQLILRGALGYLHTTTIRDFPFYYRFFAGGVNSVRGYGAQQLGPGEYLKVGSIQLQHRLYGNIFAGIFFDAGNASNKFNGPLKRGIGIAGIYQSPIGPIEITVAQANSQKNKPLRLNISIGAGL
jgi:translocation and assembly module TamA